MRRRVTIIGMALVGVAVLVGCTGPEPKGMAAPLARQVTASPSPYPSPTKPPPVTTDGCKGLITATQVARASGLPVEPSPGDAAGAAAQYSQGVQAMGLSATVRVCVFGNPAGDQVTVLALVFPDPGQATKMFGSGQAVRSLQAVGGVGEAAASDKSKTLLTRRGKAVVAVYLLAAGSPDGNHLGPLQAVATAALAKA